jgi:hypothetical protein
MIDGVPIEEALGIHGILEILGILGILEMNLDLGRGDPRWVAVAVAVALPWPLKGSLCLW